jgi:signal transduction histidine kinase
MLSPLSSSAAAGRSRLVPFTLVVAAGAAAIIAGMLWSQTLVLRMERDRHTKELVSALALALPRTEILAVLQDGGKSPVHPAVSEAVRVIRSALPSVTSVDIVSVGANDSKTVFSSPPREAGDLSGLPRLMVLREAGPPRILSDENRTLAMVGIWSKGSVVGAVVIGMTDDTPWLPTISLLPIILTLLIASVFLVLLFRLVGREDVQSARQMDKERLALLELATHQLGAPLATFRWWLEILKSPDTKTIDTKEIAVEVEQAVQRLDQIIKALTDATRVDMRKLSSHLGTLSSLRHLALQAVEELSTDLQAREMQARVTVEPDMRPVRVDSEHVSTVLRELLGNAITYSEPKSSIVVSVTTNKRKRAAQVEVQDTGMGMTPAALKRAFEKFYRAPEAVRIKPVGNGLGLFNAKGLIEQDGGEMWIKSRAGKGTSVFFTIPFDKADQSEKPVTL